MTSGKTWVEVSNVEAQMSQSGDTIEWNKKFSPSDAAISPLPSSLSDRAAAAIQIRDLTTQLRETLDLCDALSRQLRANEATNKDQIDTQSVIILQQNGVIDGLERTVVHLTASLAAEREKWHQMCVAAKRPGLASPEGQGGGIPARALRGAVGLPLAGSWEAWR